MQTAITKSQRASLLDKAMNACRDILSRRLKAHVENVSLDMASWVEERYGHEPVEDITRLGMPFVKTPREWCLVMTTLAPHLCPGFFEDLILPYLPERSDFPELGGVKGTHHRGMLPTGETFRFLWAGNDVQAGLAVQQLFDEKHAFFRRGVLWLEPVKEGEPQMSGRIVLASEWVEKLLWGKKSSPRFGVDFPASRVTTAMKWDDLVLHPRTLWQIEDIDRWLAYHTRLTKDGNLKRKVKPGYRILFFGPPGTGKTLTAALLGKRHTRDVYRIDLSQIVSKYIGETEKNLEGVFKKAERRNWILFFDEADALFGKRTSVQSSHDRYANQEVSYLLQRVEDYPGLLILASNFKNNLDDAFLRRFHGLVHFPMPGPGDRLALWQKSLPEALAKDKSVDLKSLADRFELTGAGILNAVQYATLRCYDRENEVLGQSDLLDGIRKELSKEEKTV